MRKLMFALALGGLMMSSACAAGTVSSSHESATARLTSVRRPSGTLTVAGHRYVDACQALPAQTVQKLYAPFVDASSVSDTFSQHSVAAADTDHLPVVTKCTYDFLDDRDRSVDLEVSQFATDEAAQEDWQTSVSLGDGSDEKRLTQLERQLATMTPRTAQEKSLAAQARQFLAAARTAMPRAKAALGAQAVAGLDGKILFNPSRGFFLALHHNATFKLSYSFGSDNLFDASRQISSSELATVLPAVRATYDEVFRNVDSTSLSQAPVPAVFGNQSSVGRTRLVEPCDVLGDDTFRQVFGVAPTGTADMGSTTRSVTRTGTNAAGDPLAASNTCTRRADVRQDGDVTESDLFDLKVTYFADESGAKDYFYRRLGIRQSDPEFKVTQL